MNPFPRPSSMRQASIAVLALIVSCAGALLALDGCSNAHASTEDLASLVNPMVGTGGHGHTFPGPVVPHGMIQPSPDTRHEGWDASSGYYYADSTINGFSQTHLSGTGCADYGDFLLMPTVGRKVLEGQTDTLQARPWASSFRKETENAQPGYYSVMLDRYGVNTEITSTARSALYRFTFPEAQEPGMIVDLDYAVQDQTNTEMRVEVVSDTEIRGYKMTGYWAFDQQLFFYAKFSKPFTHEILEDSITDRNGNLRPRLKALLTFAPTKADEQIMVKVGISAVDWDGAQGNLEAEIPEWDFDQIREASRQAWNQWLGKIEVETDDPEDLRVFYTAMYHAAISPNLFIDVDGRYLGMDRKVHQGDISQPVYTIFSLWDTFRALHPLLTIIDPDLNQQFIRSLLLKGKEGGVLPMWELGGNYTGTMLGYHAVAVMADALSKGQADFDVKEALNAALTAAEYSDTLTIRTPLPVRNCLMPPAKKYKSLMGYVPSDKDNEAVAKGLEYAYNDWCISLLAQAAGDTAVAHRYGELGKAYQRYYDPATGFMRGVMADGTWREPFNPNASNHRNDDYCEGNAWQWTWFAPHDVDGLMTLMGGPEAFASRLDTLFTTSSVLEGPAVSADISGLIGQYAHGNEPSHHITHLYNYAGRPWRTQELVDSVFRGFYHNSPDGLIGNEDCGQMSAWYILNAMGFYQVAPGTPVYSIGRPLMRRSTIHLPQGKSFVIEVENFSKANPYISGVTLNGKPLDRPFFNHSDLAHGGKMVITMTDRPTSWGTLTNSKTTTR